MPAPRSPRRISGGLNLGGDTVDRLKNHCGNILSEIDDTFVDHFRTGGVSSGIAKTVCNQYCKRTSNLKKGKGSKKKKKENAAFKKDAADL
jgi:hypothetical protein